jgi:hypothetical protein
LLWVIAEFPAEVADLQKSLENPWYVAAEQMRENGIAIADVLIVQE